MKNRILSITLTIFLVMTLFSTPVLAETADPVTPDSGSTHEAAIGDTTYETLSKAIEAAKDNEVVKLLINVTTSI